MMKKIKLRLTTLAILGLALFSCSDDFLEVEPTGLISEDRITEISEFNPGILNGFLLGVYESMFTVGLGGSGEAGVRRDDDLGQKGIDIYTDMLSSDMVLAGVNFGWYSDVANYTGTINFASWPNRIVWGYYYNIIFQANSVIDSQGGNDVVPESAEGKAVLGQAKAMRAYAYFYLSQLLQPDLDMNEELLPIYTSVGANVPPSPMSDVYALMTADLEQAVDLLEGFQRTAKFQVNQDVARGLLAYVYAAQGRYAEALPVAEAVVNSTNYNLISGSRLTGGFNMASDPGWIWGVDITAINNLSLLSWWGQMDIYSFSYAWAGDTKDIDESLYNSMAPDDERRAQFGDPSGQYSEYVPSQKFYNFDRPSIGGSSADNNEMDYIYMRVAEMYLLAAESAAKSGNEGLAKTYLKDLMSQRVANTDYIDLLSGQALIDEISLQTRLELWGEGKSYLLMKRSDEDRVRGENHLFFPGETINHDDPKVSFIIPQAEVLNNPFID